MENVTLTPKEQTRLQVLNSLMAEHMTLDQAATLMGVSERHIRRMLAAYREAGAAALAHGHRGRRAPNATPDSLAADVVHLAGTRYAEANHTHLSELLREREGIEIGRSTLRRILVNAGCPASTILAGLASISFAGSPPLSGPAAGLHRCGSWGRQTPG